MPRLTLRQELEQYGMAALVVAGLVGVGATVASLAYLLLALAL